MTVKLKLVCLLKYGLVLSLSTNTICLRHRESRHEIFAIIIIVTIYFL